MGLFNRSKTKNSRENCALALDIGTSVIKALIYRIDLANMKATVIGVGRKTQRLGDMQAGAVSDIKGVVQSADRAIRRAEAEAKISPKQVVLGIAGELVKGATNSVRYERLKPESKITMPELKNIIHKVQWKAFDQVRKTLSFETGHQEIDVKLINAAIVDVRIDGYRVTNPLGFQGKDVSISIFNAYAPLVHLGALQTVATDLDLDLLSITAEPYAVARCLGLEENTDFSAIFMDIGGGTTDVAVVRDGGVEGTRMFALGGRAFTRRLSQDLALDFAAAEELKIKYANRKLAPRLTQKVRKILQNDAQVWLSGVELALNEFTNIDLLPSRILLCGGGSLLPEIREMLTGSTWYKNLPLAKKPAVYFMKPGDVANIDDQTGKLTQPQDVTPLALANLSLDMVGDESVMSGILNKVVRLMQT